MRPLKQNKGILENQPLKEQIFSDAILIKRNQIFIWYRITKKFTKLMKKMPHYNLIAVELKEKVSRNGIFC